MKLRNGLSGLDGDEVARQRVEEFANKMRPTGFLVCFAFSAALAHSLTGRIQDHIKVHSVDIGASAPRLSRARIRRQLTPGSEAVSPTACNV